MSKIIGLLGVSLALCFPLTSWAICTTNGQTTPLVRNLQPFNPPKFDAGVPDGTVIYSRDLATTTGNNGTTRCPGGAGMVTWKGVGTEGPYNTYLTAIPGIGLRLSVRTMNGGAYWPTSFNWGATTDFSLTTTTVTVELVKIGPILEGGIISGEIGEQWMENGRSKTQSYRLAASFQVNPTIPTCQVTTPTVQVPMGNVDRKVFTGVGSVSSARGFNLGLSCSGGSAGVATRVYLTLTDQTRLSNVSDTLSLTPASSAKGVGVQVRNGDTVVSYGPDSKVIGIRNQWLAGKLSNGGYSIPLTARYVQTEAQVTPGTANALATFTFAYE